MSPTPPLTQSLTSLVALDAQIDALERAQAQDVTALAGEIAAAELLLHGAREWLHVYESAHQAARANEQAHARLLADTSATSLAAASTLRLVGDAARRLAAQEQAELWAERRNSARLRVMQLESQVTALRTRQQTTQSVFSTLLANLRHERSAQLERLVADTAPLEQQQPAAPSKEEMKALRAVIRRQEWEDLPAFYGSQQPAQRCCLSCDAPLQPGRKRFCSRNCHEIHLHTYGSASIPKLEELE